MAVLKLLNILSQKASYAATDILEAVFSHSVVDNLLTEIITSMDITEQQESFLVHTYMCTCYVLP